LEISQLRFLAWAIKEFILMMTSWLLAKYHISHAKAGAKTHLYFKMPLITDVAVAEISRQLGNSLS
jgi:hypothetical protein